MLTAEDVEQLFKEAAEEGDDYPDGFSIVDEGGSRNGNTRAELLCIQ